MPELSFQHVRDPFELFSALSRSVRVHNVAVKERPHLENALNFMFLRWGKPKQTVTLEPRRHSDCAIAESRAERWKDTPGKHARRTGAKFRYAFDERSFGLDM